MIDMESYTEEEAWAMFGVNEKQITELLDKMRQWLQQQPHLPQDLPDRRLRVAILFSKLNMEKAKTRLELHYTLRNQIPALYDNRDPLNAELLHESLGLVFLPKLTPEKYRVLIHRMIHIDSSTFDYWRLLKYTFMLIDLLVEEDMNNSMIMVWDLKNFTLGHGLKYSPSILRKAELCFGTYGLRLKKFYIFNAPPYVEPLLLAFKKALSAKLLDRLEVYSSGIETLSEIVPKSVLPKDYGGEQPSIDAIAEMWRNKLIKRRDWFRDQEKVKANEALRLNPVDNINDLVGVPGTFRLLEID